MGGEAPPKRGAGGKAPSLGCFCAYIAGCRHFSPFYSPHPKPPVPNRAPKAFWVVIISVKIIFFKIVKYRLFSYIFRCAE